MLKSYDNLPFSVPVGFLVIQKVHRVDFEGYTVKCPYRWLLRISFSACCDFRAAWTPQIPLLCQISQKVSPRFNLLSKMIVELTFENIFQRKIILARREAVEFLSSVKFLKMSACYSIYWAKWPYSWLLRISFSAKWFSRGVKPSNSFLLVLDLSRISHHIFREHFLQNFSREHIFREYSSYISRTLSRESQILQERLEMLKSLLCMGWLWLVGSLKIWVSFAEYRLFYRALLH